MKKKIITTLLFLVTFNGVYLQTIDIVKDIHTTGNSAPWRFTQLNNDLYFSADDGTNGSELWKSDGSTGGTTMIMDINPGVAGSNISNMIVYNNQLYFFADNGIDGRELWTSDGTLAGTMMVADLAVGGGSSNSGFINFIVYNGELYFDANNLGTSTGKELFKTNGTSSGTLLLSDINPISSSDPSQLYVFNSKLYFSADDGTNGRELWFTNGTSASMAFDLNLSGSSTPTYLMEYNGELYFSAASSTLFELYKTDGSSTTQLTFTALPGNGPQNMIVANNKLIFQYGTSTSGIELWSSDGTVGGTGILKDINPGTADSYPLYDRYVFNNVLYFSADDGTNGTELWKSDGTSSGTTMLKNINPVTYSNPGKFIEYNGSLFFIADEGGHGYELWKSNGTSAGTIKVTPPAFDVLSNPLSSGIPMVVANNILFFNGYYDTRGRELFKYSEPITSGLEETEINHMLIYPQPASENIDIEFNLANENCLVLSICSLTGEEVFKTGSINGQQGYNHISLTDMGTIAPGMYILSIFDYKKSTKLCDKKIIIQ